MEPEEITLRAATLDAAITATLDNSHRSVRQASLGLKTSLGRRNYNNDPIAYLRNLIPMAVTGVEFDGVLPFLEASERAAPYSEYVPRGRKLGAAEAEFYESVMTEAASCGVMHDHYKPQPEVETWIRSVSEQVREILYRENYFDPNNTKALLRLFIGTATGVRLIASRITALARGTQDANLDEYNFTNTAIRDVVRGLTFYLMRDLLLRDDVGGGSKPDFEVALDRFLKQKLNDGRKLTSSVFNDYRSYIQAIRSSREDIAEAFLALQCYERLPAFAEILRGSPLFNRDEVPDTSAEKDLPFGEILIVKSYGDHDDQLIYFAASGVEHLTRVLHSQTVELQGGSTTFGSTLPPDAPGYTVRDVLGYHLDDSRKVYTAAADWLAPAYQDERYRVPALDLAHVDARFGELLLQEWERYPRLFAALDEVGPAMIIEKGGSKHLVCPAAALKVARSELGIEPEAEGTAAKVLASVNISAEGEWYAFLLQALPHEAMPSVEPRSSQRARIRKLLDRHGTYTYPEFVRVLKHFGVEETKSGKGSHGSLVRIVDRQERRQGTWETIRNEQQALPIKFIWECLDRLRIGYDEFYEQLM